MHHVSTSSQSLSPRHQLDSTQAVPAHLVNACTQYLASVQQQRQAGGSHESQLDSHETRIIGVSLTVLCGLQCSFGTPDCGTYGTQTADCSCTCATGWTTYAQQDLADYVYCTVATTTSSTSNTSSTNSSTFLAAWHEQCKP